ncbi:glycosyltransferase [Alkalihalobacillus sp. MEB130]|uniref:glycosyltransferase family 2 protein n=1 Tax=Alkalihalobacillus sp. MEB130 TaxID=2976704 RepID=UPI0028E009F2|nr:glycosyltransferase family 2 protein [Alkalihalobacillus sp. MEB130]MDT8861917.1 glycosyltransferase [Alkalihalobacillus sp. MEB130]
MNTCPIVSIIIPTYNRLLELAELLESLCQQTFQDFEVIIVNDAGQSVDEVVQLYPELPCKVIDLPTNELHVHARNTGVEHARGEFVMLIDDDDWIVPTHIQRMIHAVEKVDLVHSDVEIVDYIIEENRRVPVGRRLFAYHDNAVDMKVFSTFVPSGCLYRKAIHEKIGYFDKEMKHYWDWDFYLRVTEMFHVKRLPVASVIYNFSESSENESKKMDSMRIHLDRLSRKHQLGFLPTKNFYLLLEEPDMKRREAKSERIWDGVGVHSRWKTKLVGQ